MRLTSIDIIKRLRREGFSAYWAGGCVRDMLLGIRPKDFDIATSATPNELKKIFPKANLVGEQFGVIVAEHGGHHFEIATFRSDSGYSDGRRPDAVLFTDAKEDARRRDFTINGLFYDPIKDNVVDFVGGQDDLKNKLIRFIGDPHERILEDHLRIIRAIRFKNAFGFQYHPETFAALKKHAAFAEKVSGERVRDELNKMIVSESFPGALSDMEDTGVLAAILPEMQALKGLAQPPEYHREGDVWDHTLLSFRALKPDASVMLRWAVLFHDIGKAETFSIQERIRFDEHAKHSALIAHKILRRLHFPLSEIKIIEWLVAHHMMAYNVLDMPVGRRRHWFLNPWYLDLLELNRCDALGTIPADLTTHDEVLALYRKDMKEMPREPLRLLSGEEVMKLLKLKPGKKIGAILDALRLMQLEGTVTTKGQALAWVKRMFASPHR